jgi:transposase
MFIRKKRNKSGSISVQIIDKKNGYKVIQSIGSSKDIYEIERFCLKANRIIHSPRDGQQSLFRLQSPEEMVVTNFVENLSNSQIRTVGPELIFGNLYERIGFNEIPGEMFRHLTITRLAYPGSKMKTIDYLYRYRGIKLSVASLYRYMDKISGQYKDIVGAITYRHTKQRLGTITVVFYDMTTLYFESEDEDDLRKIGYSKDGQFQKPQIMLGLLVGEGGLPIGYDIYKGNTFEGHTLIPALENIQAKYGVGKPIVVADAALLSKENLEHLARNEYHYILGARIKNEDQQLKLEIIRQALGIKDGGNFGIEKSDGSKLIVTYSDKRARKDARNRDKGIQKLRQSIQSGRLTKESINNRGYNKFLKIRGEATVEIDEEKIQHDRQWDGLKGYVTNTKLPAEQVVDHYIHLWEIEKAFRISKADLKVRPVYHYQKRRIEAHMCVAFAAYAIYKELEHLLKKYTNMMSPKRASELTHNMYELEYSLPGSNEKINKLLKMDEEQQFLYDAIYNR